MEGERISGHRGDRRPERVGIGTHQVGDGVHRDVDDHLSAFGARSGDTGTGDDATGTPWGVGNFRNPQVFLKDGDVVICEVDGVGRLENPCRAKSE